MGWREVELGIFSVGRQEMGSSGCAKAGSLSPPLLRLLRPAQSQCVSRHEHRLSSESGLPSCFSYLSSSTGRDREELAVLAVLARSSPHGTVLLIYAYWNIPVAYEVIEAVWTFYAG